MSPSTPAGARKVVTVVPGDDAAPEAVLATMRVLERMHLPVIWTVLEPGESLSTEMADASDTVLFGSTNGTTQGLAYLRWGWGTYANVRPVKWRRGVPSAIKHPEGVDYIIVREAMEDVYIGIEGDLPALLASGLDLRSAPERAGGYRRKYPIEEASTGRYALKIYTAEVVERVASFAGRLAQGRKAQGHQGKVTIGAKWNVNPRTDGFFRRKAADVLASFPDVEVDEYLADDLGRRLVASPQSLDVVLLPNLYGDILSDVGIGAVGGLGMAPSGGYGDDRAYFEPVHGTAPDIAGRHVINPTATLLSAVMMLDYLDLTDDARRLEAAVDGALAGGSVLTPDLGGTATTEAFADAVAARL